MPALDELLPVSLDEETGHVASLPEALDYIDGDPECVFIEGEFSVDQLLALAQWLDKHRIGDQSRSRSST
jgi:hypothetical protein